MHSLQYEMLSGRAAAAAAHKESTAFSVAKRRSTVRRPSVVADVYERQGGRIRGT